MQRSSDGKRYSHKKVCTLLQGTANIVNRTPFYFCKWVKLTALRLADPLLSRAQDTCRFPQLDLNLVRSYFRRPRKISGTGVPVPAEVDEGFKYKRNVLLGNFKLRR